MRKSELLKVLIGINIGIHMTTILLGMILYGIVTIIISFSLLVIVNNYDNSKGKWIKLRM